jgi:hypothetical protein
MDILKELIHLFSVKMDPYLLVEEQIIRFVFGMLKNKQF